MIVDIDEAKQILADQEDAALVSVRTWNEHIGKVSGYNYIGPAGRIAGDVWGNCGTDAYHMQHYRNVDNTMRAYPEIAANWEEAGITADKWVAFYCGTGWRASETWFYAYLMGWQRIAVYDGGWFEWSQDPVNNPIETGEPHDICRLTSSLLTPFSRSVATLGLCLRRRFCDRGSRSDQAVRQDDCRERPDVLRAAGDRHRFLGPNGSGKSTTMRLILGLDAPTRGDVTVAGKHYRDHPAPLHEVGALLEAQSVHTGRSAYNHLLALAQTHGIPKRRVSELIELVGLDSVAKKRAGQFSLGMGQRLGIAAALLGDPEVVMLDEPVNGLDPEGIRWIRDL